MIDGSVLQSAQKCFEKKSRVVVKMVVICFRSQLPQFLVPATDVTKIRNEEWGMGNGKIKMGN